MDADEKRHRIVSSGDLVRAGRWDADYWLAPDAIKAVMDERPGRISVMQAEAILDRRRKIMGADDAIRFLLDGLGVDSLAELHELVGHGREWLDEYGDG